MSVIGEISDELPKIWDIYHQFYETDKGITEDENELLERYERWHDQSFDRTPQLGYDFSVSYMLTFWKAKNKVFRYLKDPDYEVWMVASY